MVAVTGSQHNPLQQLAATLDASSTPQALLQDPRVRAMLDVIAHAEGTGSHYNMMFGGSLFDDLSRHPNIVQSGGGYQSTAAGRYQFLHGTWSAVSAQLGLADFSPQSQDLAAVQLMKQRGMIEPLLRGDVAAAIHAGAPEWASLPTPGGGSYYGQPVRELSSLTGVYDAALQRHSGQSGAPPTATEAPIEVPTPRPDLSAPAPQQVRGDAPDAASAAYTVRDGDTLWGIAQRHGIGLGQLLAFPGNEGFNSNPDLIYRGDTVQLPLSARAEYRVVAGDTLSGIAAANGMRLQALIGANPQFASGGGRNPDLIFPGETLRLMPAANAAVGPAPAVVPTVTGPDAPQLPVGAPPATAFGPYTVYSGGAAVNGPDQVRTHHSDAGGRVYQGQTLIPRDVVLEASGHTRLDVPVPSPVSGTVVDAGTGVAQHQDGHGGRGNYVILQDDQGRYVRMYHFSDVNVQAGERVEYGQALGTQGNTGRSFGAHVHIESDPAIFDRWIADLIAGRGRV